jgi:succinyl-diaminopimelate desuccinylase
VNDAEQQVLHQVELLREELVEFTRELVRLPTVNPPGDHYADCAELIELKLRDCGYSVERFAPEEQPERTNVVGTLGSGGPVLHFNGHYDVVPAENGWTVDPFGAVVQDERIYGRGTCDQKAGIAASVFAVDAIRRAGIQPEGTVEQSATPDEESGGFAGVAHLCDIGRLRADRQRYVLITEPLDPERVCIGHRGVYWFELTTMGRVGHSSMPGLAVNAAEQMARVVELIDRELRPRLRARVSEAPVEPAQARYPSINLNALHAGQPLHIQQTPTVPDRCTAVFDRRFIHEESFDAVRAEIVSLLDSAGIAYEIKDLMRVDPLLGDASSTLATTTADAIRDVLNVEPAFIASPGTYDQKHVVRRAGIADCIAYGPGRLVLAHQPDEYVGIDDLVAATKVMALLTLRLLT